MKTLLVLAALQAVQVDTLRLEVPVSRPEVVIVGDTTYVDVTVQLPVADFECTDACQARIQAAVDAAIAGLPEGQAPGPWYTRRSFWWETMTVSLLALAVYRQWNPPEHSHPLEEHDHPHEHELPDHDHEHDHKKDKKKRKWPHGRGG